MAKWSASRLKTYHACLLKYYYSYVKPYDPNMPANTEMASKGLAFHETAEQMVTGKTDQEMQAILDSKIEEYKVDRTLYPEDEALRRFMLFWKEFVATKEAEGYKVEKEGWANGEIEGKPFCGALDLALYKYKKDGSLEHLVIYDYKTAKTAAAASYKDQLVLYAYLIGMTQGWSYQQIKDNVDLFIFFPFSTQKKENDYDNMLSSVKRVNYTADDVEKIITGNISTIRESESIQWDKVNIDSLGQTNFTCKFCQFLGTVPDDSNGFRGCKCSYDQGYRQVRGLKFNLREQK